MGSLLSTAFKSSEERANTPQTQTKHWLEAAMDGLLTVEGERFMMSLPGGIEPNWLAILRPQIINELAEIRRFRGRIINRIEELLHLDLRTHQDESIEQHLRDDLTRLKSWFMSQTDKSSAACLAA